MYQKEEVVLKSVTVNGESVSFNSRFYVQIALNNGCISTSNPYGEIELLNFSPNDPFRIGKVEATDSDLNVYKVELRNLIGKWKFNNCELID